MNEHPEQPQFQIGELIGQSWNIFSKNIGLLVGAIVLMYIIIILGNWLTFGLAGIVLQGPLMLGFVALVMGLIRGQAVEFNVFFSGFQRFLPAFMANLLISIFTAIGVMLCVIPGLFVSLIYMLTFFYMFDKQLDFWPAMEASRQKIMSSLGPWILLWLILVVLNIVGMLVCFIGLLVTGPMSLIILGLAYAQVEGQASSVTAVPPEESE